MEFKDELKEEYLKQCINSCNLGGYSRLTSEKSVISGNIIKKYINNGNEKNISRLVLLCEKEVFSFLNKLVTEEFQRIFSWPEESEKKLRNQIDEIFKKDENKMKNLISEAKEVYNNPSPDAYNNFIKWANSFNGDEDGKIVEEIYNFVAKKNNHPSTLIFRIDRFYEKEILNYLSNNLPRQS